MNFQYDILIGVQDPSANGVSWRLASDIKTPLGIDLLRILNALGKHGWEVVGLGQIYFDPSTEIILKRQIP